MTFCVVVFKNENVVEAVPSNWVSKDGIKCAWPKSNFDPQKRIEKMMHPNTYEYNWFSVRVLATDIVSLKEAKIKATKATFTSDLSSSNEGKETRKDRFKKQYNDDNNCNKHSIQRIKKNKTSEAVQQKLLSPPKFIETSDVTDNDDSDADITYSPQNFKGKRKSPNQLFDEWTKEKNFKINDQQNLLCEAIKSPQKLSLSENNVTIMNSPTGIWNISDDDNCKNDMTINRERSNFDNKTQKELNDSSIAIVSPPKSKNSYKKQINFDHTPTQPTSHNLKDREIFINILRGMTSMKYEIRENTKKLDRIENMLNDIMKNPNKHLSSSLQTNNDCLVENNYFSTFPLKNIDELTVLEDKLNDNDFRLKLQTYLARLERPSVSDMTRQIMTKLFHNNLLAQFSYAGQKKKKIFSILNSCSIIFASVRSVQAHRNCTDLEILKPMKFFMANAKFREEKKNQNNNNSSN